MQQTASRKTCRRKINLLEIAAKVIGSFVGFGVTLEVVKIFGYGKNSLRATYFVALLLREMANEKIMRRKKDNDL